MVEGVENLYELFLVNEYFFVEIWYNCDDEFVEFDGVVIVMVDLVEEERDLIVVRFDFEGVEESGEFEVCEVFVFVYVEVSEDVFELFDLIGWF